MRVLPSPPFMHGAAHWVAFNFFTNGNTIVLPAVPDHLDTDDLLATIEEARDLARLRGVGPQDLRFLGTLLPALLLPASLSADVPAIKLEALAALATPSSGVLGKA